MRSLFSRSDVDKSDLTNYPSGRIKDNDGSNNGTAVNEATKGDFHQMLEKLMRLYDIIPNGLPDNELNGFQLIQALSALASKNDYIYPLTTNGNDTLSIDIKLHLMKENEFLVCLASTDKTTENLIKGSDATTFAVTYSGNFKANEYVKVVKTGAGVSIIRVADWNSLSAMASELGFLKKASQAQENAGAVDTVATTPLVNKITYTLRTIGADSVNYLASIARNGLYPKEHFAIVASLGVNAVRNVGYFEALDVGGGSLGALAVSGDISSAIVTNTGGGYSIIRCIVNNTMTDTNYEVQASLQSLGTMSADNTVLAPVYKIINATTFDISFRETSNAAQSIRVRLRVIKI